MLAGDEGAVVAAVALMAGGLTTAIAAYAARRAGHGGGLQAVVMAAGLPIILAGASRLQTEPSTRDLLAYGARFFWLATPVALTYFAWENAPDARQRAWAARGLVAALALGTASTLVALTVPSALEGPVPGAPGWSAGWVLFDVAVLVGSPAAAFLATWVLRNSFAGARGRPLFFVVWGPAALHVAAVAAEPLRGGAWPAAVQRWGGEGGASLHVLLAVVGLVVLVGAAVVAIRGAGNKAGGIALATAAAGVLAWGVLPALAPGAALLHAARDSGVLVLMCALPAVVPIPGRPPPANVPGGDLARNVPLLVGLGAAVRVGAPFFGLRGEASMTLLVLMAVLSGPSWFLLSEGPKLGRIVRDTRDEVGVLVQRGGTRRS